MGNQRKPGSALDVLSGLLAFVLSAVLGVAFLALVDKTHDLFTGSEEQRVIGTWQVNRQGRHQ